MKLKNKNLLAKIAISTGAITAIVAPVVTTVAYQTKTAAKAVITNVDRAVSTTLYTMPEDLPSHFETSLAGFKGIYQTLERLYPEIKVDYTKIESFYNENKAKADNLIILTNAILTHRSFWSDIWDGIKHAATSVISTVASLGETVVNGIKTAAVAVGTGVVEVADAVSGGALDSATKTMENLTVDSAKATANSAIALGNNLTDLIKDVFGVDLKDLSHSDWLKLGLSVLFIATPGAGELMGVAQIGEAAAEKVTEGFAEGATKTFLGALVKKGSEAILGVPYVEFTKASIQYTETFSMTDVKNQTDFPANFINNVKPGDYYFKNGDTGIHLFITN